MFKGHVARGTVEGTGAALNIQCGFTPAHVRVLNVDGLATMEWTSDFADGTALKTVTAGTMSLAGSNGITPYAGTAGGDSAGFTIGADADVNVSAETINWVAYGAE